MAKIGFPKGSGKRLKVREKLVKSQGILKWLLSGNPDIVLCVISSYATISLRVRQLVALIYLYAYFHLSVF